MQDKEKGSFSFINEKIKAKPLNKKRLVIRTVFVVAMAVIFGLVSALVFTYFQPKFENMLYPEEKPMVTIPKDDTEETEEPVSESSETEETEQKDTQAESGNAGTETQGTEKSELEIADFQKLQNKLYAVGREANKSIVTVTGVKSDTDWFNNPYESRGQSSGIIVAENGRELLILTERKAITDVQEIYVTFVNDTTVEAAMKKYDGNTGIAILSVPLTGIEESTRSAISTAVLGNPITMA